jgi:hypothetical protein
MEKEFTKSLARVKMENQRTIDETIRIRDELMQMCKPKISEEEDYLRRVDDNQSPEIARIQLEVLRKKAARCEKELRENEERHEMELAQEKASTAAKDQELLQGRKKIKELLATIRDYEDNLLGLQPAVKKIKVDNQGLVEAVAVEEPEPSAPERGTRTEPIRTEPVRTEPVRTVPNRSEPNRTGPNRTAPVRTVPNRTGPIRTEPNRTEPIRTDPNLTEPNRPDPNRTEPYRTGPNQTDTERTRRPNFGV